MSNLYQLQQHRFVHEKLKQVDDVIDQRELQTLHKTIEKCVKSEEKSIVCLIISWPKLLRQILHLRIYEDGSQNGMVVSENKTCMDLKW